MRPPRQIYIDLGVNFGDTLDLFERLDNRREEDRRASAAAWEVFGFEAVPSPSPYLEELFRHKNGEGARPVWCFPPVGSTFDKMRFASMLGCERTWTPKMTSCMSTVFGQAERQMLQDLASRMQQMHGESAASPCALSLCEPWLELWPQEPRSHCKAQTKSSWPV